MDIIYRQKENHSSNGFMSNGESSPHSESFPNDVKQPQSKVDEAHLAFKLSSQNRKTLETTGSLTSLAALALHESNKITNSIGFNKYNKQLVNTRIINYHQHSMRKLNSKEVVEEKRRSVVRRVARELWTNFCVLGQKTPMLDYLHKKLKDKYGADLEFYYYPDSLEVVICRIVDGETIPIDKLERINIVNNSWQLAQELVDSYTMSA